MKKIFPVFFLLSISALSVLGLAQWITPEAHQTPIEVHHTTRINADTLGLMNLLDQLEGSWVDQGYATGFITENLMFEPEPDFLIDIRPENRRGNMVAIYVSEYCRPEEADYLLFEYVKGKLVYAGAEWDACFLDIPRIDFMVMGYDETNDRLLYEARETEFQEHKYLEMVRRPVQDKGWHCYMQDHIIELLTRGDYILLSADKQMLTLKEAFGQENLLEDLQFFEQFSTLWPMYEEICIRAPFEVVVLGGLHPGSQQKIYAIEWTSSEVRLFETHAGLASEDGVFPLEKGALKIVIIPNFSIDNGPIN